MISQTEYLRVERIVQAAISKALRGLESVESVDYPINGRIDAKLKIGADVSISVEIRWDEIIDRAEYGAVAQADGAIG